MPREALLARSLVELADNLVEDFDIVELLTLLPDRCVEVLDVAAAGLILASPGGDLAVMAYSSDAMRLLEVFELRDPGGAMRGHLPRRRFRHQPGPRRHRGQGAGPGSRPGPGEPGSTRSTRSPCGFAGPRSALSTCSEPGPVTSTRPTQPPAGLWPTSPPSPSSSTAPSSTPTPSMTSSLRRSPSRVVIEQAKGVIAESSRIGIQEAFERLRAHARSNNLRLTDVARSVVDRSLAVNAVKGRVAKSR